MPPPSKDQLSRPVDISTLFRGAAREVDLKVDGPGLRRSSFSESGSARRRVGPHRVGLTFSDGRENVTPGRIVSSSTRGRDRLPRWHPRTPLFTKKKNPRTPLRDITAIVRAIERKRARLHQDDHETREEAKAQASSSSLLPFPNLSTTPEVKPTPKTKVGKIMANILNEKGQDSISMTPQKRLLDSIDEVGEVLVDEQRKKEKNPAAQKAETKKKVRTLMLMR